VLALKVRNARGLDLSGRVTNPVRPDSERVQQRYQDWWSKRFGDAKRITTRCFSLCSKGCLKHSDVLLTGGLPEPSITSDYILEVVPPARLCSPAILIYPDRPG
jgi:hypothetical protein